MKADKTGAWQATPAQPKGGQAPPCPRLPPPHPIAKWGAPAQDGGVRLPSQDASGH